MKTIHFFKTLVIILLLSNSLVAQNKCCLTSTIAPEISTIGSGATVGLNQMTTAATLAVNASSDLPNVEYIITKQGTVALDGQGQPQVGNGAVIIGTDVDGAFIPANQNRYGISLQDGNSINVMAVGYDLLLMQELTDSLLNSSLSNGQPCCDLFGILGLVVQESQLGGFCDTLNNAGIYTGSDVTDFEDVLTILSPFIDGQLSVATLIYIFGLINGNGLYFTQECGGTGANNFVPYGFRGFGNFTYRIGTVVPSNTCCMGTTVAPELSSGIHGTLIATNENTPTPALGVNASADLPNVEYLITKRNLFALDALGQIDTTRGGGDVVIGADEDGIFMPMDKGRYGITLSVGDTFDIVAMGYDLTKMKNLVDLLLNGTQGGQPCCGLFTLLAAATNKPYLAGFCDSVISAGILGTADLNNMEDLLSVFDAFSNTQTSLGSIIATLELLNNNGTFIPNSCGGTSANDFIPYGLHVDKKYAYVVDNPLVVTKLSSVSLFMIYPNPAEYNLVNVYFTTSQEVYLGIKMFDALGQQVHAEVLNNVSGDFSTTIPVQNLAAGMYYIELTDGHRNQVQKVMVK